MSPGSPKIAHLTLSEHTIEQLRNRGQDLREMAKTARLDADIHALEALAARFDRFAARRRGTPDDAPSEDPPALARTGGSPQFPPCPAADANADFAGTWQLACQHLSQRYVIPETIFRPEVIGQCYNFACMLVAYGIVHKARPPARLAEAQRGPASDVHHHRVIVVDDVADVLVGVGAFLVHAGFSVIKAVNGDDALRVISRDPSIDVLVTDFVMPGLNGADLIAQATQIRPSLKALVITGYPNADGLADLPSGTKILAKPFRRDALVSAVKSLLGGNTERSQTVISLAPLRN
jgi:CheY-like chemotaxis protein